jgi:hypothetical protein
MSRRPQVLLDPDEWEQRLTLREAREREPRADLDTKLRAIRAIGRHEFPTADIEQMLEEIERGQDALPPSAP